jgi:outer membrane protein
MSLSWGKRRATGWAAVVIGVAGLWPAVGSAETIESALARAYQNNPQLNAQRAAARATDELVPQALSGYRPRVGVFATGGEQYSDTTTKNVTNIPGGQTLVTYDRTPSTQSPYSVGATATQTLFDGFQTPNRTRAAEGQVAAAREALRVMEQTVLLAAATAYMDVRRDTENLDVQRANVRALEDMLRQTRERLKASDVTATDVAQAEAQLAAGRSALLAAEAALNISKAVYVQVIGAEPVDLAPAGPVDRAAPGSIQEAIDQGVLQNPSVLAAMHGVDVSYLQVKINEGALFPTLTLQANVQHANSPQFGIVQQTSASVVGQLSVPIYQGGAEYSLIRQSKESLAQQRLNLDVVRNQVRQSVVQAWSQLEAAKRQLDAAHVQTAAARTALDGVSQEALVGQRTTFDVLNAQQLVVNARVAEVVAQHDLVVASYALLSAVGRLSPVVLNLPTPTYDPTAHYRQVRDAWFGVRTPADGQFGVAATNTQAAPTNVARHQPSRPAVTRTVAKEKAHGQTAQIVHAAWSPPLPTPGPAAASRQPMATSASPEQAKPANPPADVPVAHSAPEPGSQPQDTAATPAPAPPPVRAPAAKMAQSKPTPDRFSTGNNSGLLSVGGDGNLFSSGSNSGVLSGVQPMVPAAGTDGRLPSLR